MKSTIEALEQIKTVTIADHDITLVRLHYHPNAWADRDSARRVEAKRAREIAALKRDCARLRGLLRDLD